MLVRPLLGTSTNGVSLLASTSRKERGDPLDGLGTFGATTKLDYNIVPGGR
jgi:hypothetical protein